MASITETEGPLLPLELIDMILAHLFDCPIHPHSMRPCASWHTPSLLPQLLPLRLVNHYFRNALTPVLFNHITFRKATRHRGNNLSELSRHKTLAQYVQVLRLDVNASDLGVNFKWFLDSSSTNVQIERKVEQYLSTLYVFLCPILACFTRLKTLHLSTSYDGLGALPGSQENRSPQQKRLAPVPINRIMEPCLTALCRCVRKAKLREMEELVLGLPYEGGYTTFFEDLHDKKYYRMLRNAGKNVTSASVKLFDCEGNFTTMSFF